MFLFPCSLPQGPVASLSPFPERAGCRWHKRLILRALWHHDEESKKIFSLLSGRLRGDEGVRGYVTRLACQLPAPNWLRLTMPWFWSLPAPSSAVPRISPSRISPSRK